MHVAKWGFLVGVVLLSSTSFAKPSDAEKAKQKAEKKLEAFQKEYDPSKNLSRKGTGLPKDIEALDKEIEALTALDAAAGTELKGRRDAAVSAAQQAVGGAEAEKASEAIDKKLEKYAKEFDPEKKKLDSIDPKNIERARKDLDEAIAKLEASARAPYEAKRDELFGKLESGIGDAKTTRRRAKIEPPEPVAAANGVETIAPMKPTWCEGVLEARGKAMDNYFPPVPREWTGRLTDVVVFSCVDPEWDVRQKIVAAWRQKLSNTLRIDAATNERLVKLGARMEILQQDKANKGMDKAHCDALKPVAAGSAAERGNRALERMVMGCGNRLSSENAMRMIDLDSPGAFTSQLAMAGFIFRVLGESTENEAFSAASASDVAVLNQLALDASAFEGQLGGYKLNEFGQAAAILAWYGQKGRFESTAQAVRDAAKKFPALTKMTFDAPSAAAKDYVGRRAAQDKPILDVVLSMEANPGATDGCAKKLYPFLVNELKPQGKAQLTELNLSGLLAWALTECARRDAEVPMMEAVFTNWAERTTAVRGPLTAAYLAYVDAYNEASVGQMPAPSSSGFSKERSRERGGPPAPAMPTGLPAPRRNPMGEAALTDSRFGHENSLNLEQARGGGVVKGVEKKGEVVTITFRTEKFMVPDLECVETNRIDRINPDGTIVYRRNCRKVGEHEEQSTLEPVQIPAWAAGGVSAGNYIEPLWGSINGGANGRAWVLQSFDSKARGKRTSLLGIAQ